MSDPALDRVKAIQAEMVATLLNCAGVVRLPEPTAAELARGLAGAFDSPSMHQFDSWTDKDLYRAIAGEPEGPGHDAAVAEYVAELNARGAARAAQARLEADVNAKYGIVRDGIFPADEA